jgi:hypothetical protein
VAKFIVMPVEGILRDPIGGHIIPDGFYLYRTLSSMYEIILTTQEHNRSRTMDWLAMEGIFKYAQIVFPDYRVLITDNEATNLRRHLWLQGYNINFWVCNDAELAKDLLTIGEAVMLIIRPQYAMPEWHPDTVKGGPKWDDLVKKTLLDKAAKMADTRTEVDEP